MHSLMDLALAHEMDRDRSTLTLGRPLSLRLLFHAAEKSA